MSNKFFIGIDKHIKEPYKSSSLLFRRHFLVRDLSKQYVLKIIGLGIGVYYLNGRKITSAVLLQSPSDYEKTLWEHSFNITKLLKKGENVLACELGNGFFNEGIETNWHLEKAYWRKPKCLNVRIYKGDKLFLRSDEKFLTKYSLFRTYNELRSGEKVDFNFYEEFYKNDYDDSSWKNAEYVKEIPSGQIRELDCPLMKEFENRKPVRVINKKDRFIFDFGENFSGYAKIKAHENKGTKIKLRYAEDLTKDNELELHGLGIYHFAEMQTEEIISGEKPLVFSPSFAYYGFRYIEVSGINNLKDFSIEGIFIHNDIKIRKHKIPEDENIKKLYSAVINSTLSNTYYMFTDCPTREKLGWLNDAQSSLEQIIYNFDARKILKKWYQDILDSVDEKGNVPGIAPSHKWGYEYGPLCGAIIGAVPYYFSTLYHDDSLFHNSIKIIERYYRYVSKNENNFILGDWTGAINHPLTPHIFVMKTYEYILCYFISYYYHKYKNEKLNKKYQEKMNKISHELLNIFKQAPNCYSSQTMMSVLLVLGIGDKKQLITHLVKAIKDNDYVLDVGMFGNQFVYKALKRNGYKDFIYRIVFNDKHISFKTWLDSGNNTLYETFNDAPTVSLNHHMYSSVIMELLDI